MDEQRITCTLQGNSDQEGFTHGRSLIRSSSGTVILIIPASMTAGVNRFRKSEKFIKSCSVATKEGASEQQLCVPPVPRFSSFFALSASRCERFAWAAANASTIRMFRSSSRDKTDIARSSLRLPWRFKTFTSKGACTRSLAKELACGSSSRDFLADSRQCEVAGGASCIRRVPTGALRAFSLINVATSSRSGDP